MVSRPEAWWLEVFWVNDNGRALFEAVHEDAAGRVDGYVSYEIKGEWFGGFADKDMYVWDLQAANPVARAALWEFVFGVDLVAQDRRHEPSCRRAAAVHARRPAPDAYRVLQRFALALAARRCRAARRRGRTRRGASSRSRSSIPTVRASRFALEGSPDGSSCRESAASSPDLSCSRSALGALLLGGNSWATLTEAGEVDEHASGAVARADAMFATAPLPATLTWF